MTYLPLFFIKILLSGEFLDIMKIIEGLVIRVEVGNLPCIYVTSVCIEIFNSDITHKI